MLEAAEYNQQYTFNSNITMSIPENAFTDGSIILGPGSEIKIDLNQGIDTVQWMSNDLRDSWSTIHSYDYSTSVILNYYDIVEELEHLPGTTLHANHTLSIRALEGTTSSPLISVDITLTEEVLVATASDETSSLNYVIYGSVFAAIILTIVLVIAFMNNESEKEAVHQRDLDIEEVVEAEIVE